MINYLIHLARELNSAPRITGVSDSDSSKIELNTTVIMSDKLAKSIAVDIEDIGWEINKVVDWYDQVIAQVDIHSVSETCHCPICKSFWPAGYPEMHNTGCWISSLKRTAYMAESEVKE